jgi:hypothetical protein
VDRIEPLATVHTSDGHTIERYRGDVLHIIDKRGHEVDDDTAFRLARWFWSVVAVPTPPRSPDTEEEEGDAIA